MNQLIKDQNGDWVQTRDGKPVICPFRSPIPVPGQLAGQVHYIAINCTSQCPFFHVDINDNPIFVKRLCVSGIREILVEEVVDNQKTPPPPPENKKRIINLH